MASSEVDDEPLECTVPVAAAGQRLDQTAAQLFDHHSRARLQRWIEAGHLSVDGAIVAPRTRLRGGERLSLTVPEGQVEVNLDAVRPEPVPLDIIHEDESVIVLNKAAGQVMHPAPGHAGGTVMNGLLYYAPELIEVPRAGIVHRLDRDTTGLCVVARTPQAQTDLVRQLQARSVGRHYLAVVAGTVEPEGIVDAAIARHPVDRKRMAVVRTRLRSDVVPRAAHGKPAITHYRARQELAGCSVIELRLETGRTHQIRVHMTHIGHPLLGDPVYQQRRPLDCLPKSVREAAEQLGRQALHAMRLEFIHPRSAEAMVFDAPVPHDLGILIDQLHTIHTEYD